MLSASDNPRRFPVTDSTTAVAQPVSLSTNRARGGVTGHRVRYVLAFGLAGIILAFIVIGLAFGI